MKQKKSLQFGEFIFGIQLAAGIRNLTVLSTILSRTVTNDNKNDKMTRPHVHLREERKKKKSRVIQPVDLIFMLLLSLRTCMTDNSNSKNLDLRVFLH